MLMPTVLNRVRWRESGWSILTRPHLLEPARHYIPDLDSAVMS